MKNGTKKRTIVRSRTSAPIDERTRKKRPPARMLPSKGIPSESLSGEVVSQSVSSRPTIAEGPALAPSTSPRTRQQRRTSELPVDRLPEPREPRTPVETAVISSQAQSDHNPEHRRTTRTDQPGVSDKRSRSERSSGKRSTGKRSSDERSIAEPSDDESRIEQIVNRIAHKIERLVDALTVQTAMLGEHMQAIASHGRFHKDVLTFEEACSYLDLSESHLYKLTADGIVPHSKPNGKRIYFKRAELDAWLTSNPVKTQAELERDAARYFGANRRGSRRADDQADTQPDRHGDRRIERHTRERRTRERNHG